MSYVQTTEELISYSRAYEERRGWFQTLCEIRKLEETPNRD